MKNLFHENPPLLFDGSKGVLLQMAGLAGHEAAEEWNISHPEEVRKVYRSYVAAGSQAIQTNTFPGNSVTLGKHGLGDQVYRLNFEGVRLAVEEAGDRALVGASCGPTGEFLEPMGDLRFEDAVKAFKMQMQAVADGGADFVSFETFTDLQELRVAITALKETSNLPFVASLSFEGNCRTLSGNPCESCAIVCQSMGALLVGANCSGGPESLKDPIRRMYAVASVPLLVKPNAGLPELEGGRQVYHSRPEDFNSCLADYLKNGVRLVGGCCGSTPLHIAAMKEQLAKEPLPPLALKPQNHICSALSFCDPEKSRACLIDTSPFQNDWESLQDELMDSEGDYFLLDFSNQSLCPDFWELLSALSVSIRQPLAIKTENPEILCSFLRYYPGRAGVIIPPNDPVLEEISTRYNALKL